MVRLRSCPAQSRIDLTAATLAAGLTDRVTSLTLQLPANLNQCLPKTYRTDTAALCPAMTYAISFSRFNFALIAH